MELTRGSQPVKGDHTVPRGSTQSRKPPSPSFNQSDGPSSRSSSRNSTRSPSTHWNSPIAHKNDRRTPSPGGLKNKKKKSKEGKDSGGDGKQSPRNPSPSTLKNYHYNSSGDEKSSSQPHRRSRSGPPAYRTKTPSSRGSTPDIDGPDDNTNSTTTTKNASKPRRSSGRAPTARAPTELDKTFLATSSNQHIAGDDFHDMELEEIQSQLQERAAKVIQHTHTGNQGFTRFSSSALCIDPSQADNIQIKKVSPRRPSLNSQISKFTNSDFDAVSETSDISSSRLNVSGPISQPDFTVDNAAYVFDSMSLSDLEIMEKILVKKKLEKARTSSGDGGGKSKGKKNKKGKKGGKSSSNNNNANITDSTTNNNEPLPPVPPSAQSPSQATAQAVDSHGDDDNDDNRGRTRSDSIGPEIRKAKIIARLDSNSGENNSSKSAATPDSDPSPVSTTPPAIPTDGQISGVSASPERRPGAPNLQMFASSYHIDPDRAQEVADRLAQRERDNERDGKLGIIGSMISNDKKSTFATSSSSIADNTTDFDTSSDIMCSMYSDTNSFYSDDEDIIEEEQDVRPSSYSKSPKQLSFANGRPPPNVPTLQLEVLRSPRGERDRVKAPVPDRAVATLTEGDKAFSPRSISESEFST